MLQCYNLTVRSDLCVASLGASAKLRGGLSCLDYSFASRQMVLAVISVITVRPLMSTTDISSI